MKVFITGITGSLGTAIAKLHFEKGDSVTGCARNEARGVAWIIKHGQCGRLLFCDAGAADPGMLSAVADADRVYHCAAMKHVSLCELNPVEAWRQNVWLTGQFAGLCGPKMVFISTDKACLPQGVYGATKLTGERIVTQAGGAVVRFGNLIGSSGSVINLWMSASSKNQPIKVTDPDMTRYFLSVKEAAWIAVHQPLFGKVVIPSRMKSVRMGELSKQFSECPEVIGPKAGETKHQWLVAPGDRCMKVDSRIIMSDEDGVDPCIEGMRSDTAPRWETQELMREINQVTKEQQP